MTEQKTEDTIIVPVLELSQPVGKFYTGVIEARDLYAIAYADIRRTDGRDVERYIGTQRDLSEARVAEIKKYVTNVDACFPSGIILAIDSGNCVQAKTVEGYPAIAIRRASEVAKIIDGQHRVAGFENYNGDPFLVNVTIFVDMDLEDQAMVFATINLKQTKVTKSLAYDLYEFAQARSPHKTAHNIAKLMNFKSGSPLEGFIKILGKSGGSELESITQATFVDRLLKLISIDPMSDKDLIKRGKRPDKAEGEEQRKRIFRNLFLEDNDALISLILWEYFQAVKKRWPIAWTDRSKGALLGRTTGFAALLRLLPELISRITDKPLGKDSDLISSKEFLSLLQHININDDAFVSTTYVPGSSGEGQLHREMLQAIQQIPTKW